MEGLPAKSIFSRRMPVCWYGWVQSSICWAIAYDVAQIARIRASAASDVFLSLSQLQAQGIPISYDPVYDEFKCRSGRHAPKGGQARCTWIRSARLNAGLAAPGSVRFAVDRLIFGFAIALEDFIGLAPFLFGQQTHAPVSFRNWPGPSTARSARWPRGWSCAR